MLKFTGDEALKNLNHVADLDKAIRLTLTLMPDDVRNKTLDKAIEIVCSQPDAFIDMVVMLVVSRRLKMSDFFDGLVKPKANPEG